MKITFNKVTIDGNAFEIAMTVVGALNDGWSTVNQSDMKREIQRNVTDVLTAEYLKTKTQEILGAIDQQQVINMIILNSAGKISGRDR